MVCQFLGLLEMAELLDMVINLVLREMQPMVVKAERRLLVQRIKLLVVVEVSSVQSVELEEDMQEALVPMVLLVLMVVPVTHILVLRLQEEIQAMVVHFLQMVVVVKVVLLLLQLLKLTHNQVRPAKY
jgi:hypothetical protein